MNSMVNYIINSKDPKEADFIFMMLKKHLIFKFLTYITGSLWEQNKYKCNQHPAWIEQISKSKDKNPVGIIEEREINDTTMQGETLSSILCTDSVDKISKDCALKPYLYKGEVEIPKMSFCNYILDINE